MPSIFGRRDFLGSALTFGAVGAAGASLAEGAQGGEARSSKSGSYRFVNLNRVMESWSRAKKLQEEFSAEFEKRTDALKSRLADAERKRQEARSYQQGGSSEEGRRREREVALSLAEIQYDQEQLKKDRDERRVRVLLSAYQQIQDAVGKWAAQNGVDCVFTIQEDDTQSTDLAERYGRILVRQVLWHSKDLDISEEIVKLLEASSPAPSAPAPAVAPATRPASKDNK